MNLEQELFKDNSKYIYLRDAKEGARKQAVPAENIRDIICIAEETLYPEDLKMVDGSVVPGTGMFMKAFFTTIDGSVDYCFQDGKDNCGNDVSTLVKVKNYGKIDPRCYLFLRNNHVMTDDCELLVAQYIATYKDQKWHILDKADRDGKLDCESPEVLSRAHEYVFSIGA